MIASTNPGTHNQRISAQTVTNSLREIGERPPYTMYVLYAAYLFWPSIYLSTYMYIYCIYLSIHPYINLSIYECICLSGNN